MDIGIDVLENDILNNYPGVLETLLKDNTTKKNIFWATNNYEHLGKSYDFYSQIFPDLITGINGNVIMPRVNKIKSIQESRSKEMAEVFTPPWVCNSQNNLIDDLWFEDKNVFNYEIVNPTGQKHWVVNNKRIVFPKNKNWLDYIKSKRIEVACGEAPYITSRYDSTTGDFIEIKNRIGVLDRKLRIINENTNLSKEWLEASRIAYKSTYGFEWQGDSLLLAREAMLATFIENYHFKFKKQPTLNSINSIAKIISWNIWQMDGLKGVIPGSCRSLTLTEEDLFGKRVKKTFCSGCTKENIYEHNGTYSIIKDWTKSSKKSKKIKGREIRFIDAIKK